MEFRVGNEGGTFSGIRIGLRVKFNRIDNGRGMIKHSLCRFGRKISARIVSHLAKVEDSSEVAPHVRRKESGLYEVLSKLHLQSFVRIRSNLVLHERRLSRMGA